MKETDCTECGMTMLRRLEEGKEYLCVVCTRMKEVADKRAKDKAP